MKKPVVAFLIILAAAIGFAVLARARAEEEPAAAPPPLRTGRRAADTVVKATGVIKPMIGAEVRVGSRISGEVRRLFVRVGDAIRAGEPLAELDDRDLRARQNQAAAEVELSAANLAYASADLARKRELSAAALLADSDLDLAQRAFAVAGQQHRAARAALAFNTTQLGYAKIFAPISGVVASVSTQEGETVAASFATPTFVTLIDLSRLEVWAYVDETDIGRVRVGQRARFTVDTYGDDEFEGTLTAVYPKPEIRDNVVNYIAVIRFEAPHDRTLRPEMTATVRIAAEAREKR